MDPQDVIERFRHKARRFYLLNAVFAVAIGSALYLAKTLGFYKEAFIPIVLLFLIWIFNADKLYRCPNCAEVPRGKEGLIWLPKRCAHCGVALQ